MLTEQKTLSDLMRQLLSSLLSPIHFICRGNFLHAMSTFRERIIHGPNFRLPFSTERHDTYKSLQIPQGNSSIIRHGKQSNLCPYSSSGAGAFWYRHQSFGRKKQRVKNLKVYEIYFACLSLSIRLSYRVRRQLNPKFLHHLDCSAMRKGQCKTCHLRPIYKKQQII